MSGAVGEPLAIRGTFSGRVITRSYCMRRSPEGPARVFISWHAILCEREVDKIGLTLPVKLFRNGTCNLNALSKMKRSYSPLQVKGRCQPNLAMRIY